jgi:hypothetical protein
MMHTSQALFAFWIINCEISLPYIPKPSGFFSTFSYLFEFCCCIDVVCSRSGCVKRAGLFSLRQPKPFCVCRKEQVGIHSSMPTDRYGPRLVLRIPGVLIHQMRKDACFDSRARVGSKFAFGRIFHFILVLPICYFWFILSGPRGWLIQLTVSTQSGVS